MTKLTLALTCSFSLSLLAARYFWTGYKRQKKIPQQKPIRGVPLIFVCRATLDRLPFALCAVGWLLFFPNGPYLLTDFVHLRPREGVPLWFDLGLLASFAWTGLLAASVSLYAMHQRVEKRFGQLRGWLFVAAVAALSGFGIWLGRFVRLNSWDVVMQPMSLVSVASQAFLHPLENKHAWAVTALFGGLFFVVCSASTRMTHQRQLEFPIGL